MSSTSNATEGISPSHDLMVVGIGASAGGLKPLMTLFEQMPERTGMAFVVILHLSPDYESNIAGLLQKSTQMPVTEVRQGVDIEPNHVYVISPKSQLHIRNGRLEPIARVERSHPMSIDVFFRMLAESHAHRAIAIVLSGTGSDGSQGVKDIKTHGGVSIVQSPQEAEYDAMPRNAIASGAVDFVLPMAELPGKLVTLWRNAQAIELPAIDDKAPEDLAERAEDALRDVLAILRVRSGHDFLHYKRSTLLRRIERRLQVNQLRDLPTYRDFLNGNPEETRSLLRDLLVSVTSFFRDPEVFEAFEKNVIPMLLSRREKRGGVLRLWVVGCATGEEVYSLAIVFAEHFRALADPPELNIFATDIDEDALAVARAGLYPEAIRESVSAERLQHFFIKEQGGYRVQKHLRDMVLYAAHNVIQDPPFSRMDLLSCRNLLIYVNRLTQAKILDLLHFALRPNGYLLLGSAESVDEVNEGFIAVDKKHHIFQQQPRAQSGMILPLVPMTHASRANGEGAGTTGRRLVSYGELHQKLLEHYAPPSIVVDERFDIVHLSETAGRFLQIGPGEPSLNLIQAVPPELRMELRYALEHAMQSMMTVERRNVAVSRGPERALLTLRVHPVQEKRSTRTYSLVLFEEEGAADEGVEPDVSADGDAVSGLRERLEDTEALLRGAVAQQEIRNEELKASNEELQATNEELRAAGEELETGKEELQSINEELQTVNQELKTKVDEATRIRDDLQNFINATEIAVLFVDRDLRLMRFTPFARKVFNVRANDVGRPLLDITNRLVDEDIRPDIEKLFESLTVTEREVRATDGSWLMLRILPYRTTEDRIDGAVLTFIDVTQRKLAEETVRRNEAWLRLLLDSVHDYAILTLDPQGVIASWNRGAELIFGYSAAEAVGQPLDLIFLPEERSAGMPQTVLRTARETGRSEDERWHVRKDGSRFFASGVTAPLLDPSTYGYVKLLRDLTGQQVATQQRDELLVMERMNRTAAEQASRMKDEFLATLSHELRNPLALIQMQAELLLRAAETRRTPRLASAAEIIHQTVKAQAQFVDDMLDVSRARTGKLAIDRQLLPLPLVIADSIGALRHEAEANAITLNVELDAEPMIVEADVVRVKQIAWNLLSNALKFTPHGGQIIVRLKREGNEARLDVEDNGQGIAPEMQQHIFEWFRQAESGSTRRKGGMGIGLALVKQLVELHGGRVQGYSAGLGKGSCFSVWLPLQVAESRIPAAMPAAAPGAVAPGRLAGLRLLIIDDLRDNADAMGELLRYEGADVTIETTAQGAIRRAQAGVFDGIISDLAMPKMDGHTLLRKLRSTSLNADTPAIAYSGYGGADETSRSKSAGFELHLTKPVDIDVLLDSIESIVNRARQNQVRLVPAQVTRERHPRAGDE